MMGCICCKPSAIEDSKDSPRERPSIKASSDVRVSRATSSRREEAYRAKDRYDKNEGRIMLIDKQVNGSVQLHDENLDRKREKMEYVVSQQPGMGSVPKAAEGEQVAAGWPAWLAAVAGEAIRGWVPRRADSFEKLDKIGQGTYSNVYRARDIDQKKVVALKKVRFDNLEPESVRFMAREIHILRRLDHPNVIKLEGLVTSRMSCSLYLVFEYMEHDLAGLASHPGLKFSESQVEQLHKIFKLCGSPSEDYWRKSKLPHATIFKPQQPYRGCVAETFKEFPAPALALMETLLSINPADRGSAASALNSEFFTTKPLPCDPSSLPKYPPSKEFDAKIRDDEARRQGGAGTKGQRPDLDRRATRESRAIPAPDANAELALSMQKRQGQSNSKSRSEKFNPHPEEVASGFPIDPPRPSQGVESNADVQGNHHKRASHSGPLAHRAAWAKSAKNLDDAPKLSTGADLSMMSSLVAARRSNLISEDLRERSGSSQSEAPRMTARFPGSIKEASESFIQQDPKHNVQQKEDGRSSNQDPVLLGYGSKGHKIHYSGPLIVPSGNMDQILKDHDRQIQEAVRRARLDKAKIRKVQLEGNQISTNSFFVSGR
ncbi:probable serine/threonine-protein kinase At1g09600 isoform X2 [Durio zibethinus]|uniref:Probable serine/threonine-protein kinase At1g09600 isoform X2 n=1 Tax=Durio zibethinus TaxID=66656 RepID=A0A6P5ZL31_DURZI|nr:probable serine/threonine-protein kinase At1g09600 isoform X2 [Durio zibethinus]